MFLELLGIFSLIRFFRAPAASDFVARHEKLAQVIGIFLHIGLNMCSGRSTESSHGDGFFEYPQLAIFVAIEEKLALKLNVF